MSSVIPVSQPRRHLLSVVIPAYNAADTLGEQLDALKAQTYDGDWEIVVVDNGSTDTTAEVVHGYRRLMPYLRLVHAPEVQGREYACNVGARAAKGDALIFCDADDVAAPGWLLALAEALEKHHLVAGRVEIRALNQSAIWRPTPPNWAVDPALGFLPFAIGCNMALSREAFEAAGGFSGDTHICEDVDLSWRLQLHHGYTVHYAPAAVMHYRYRKKLRAMWKQTVAYAEAQACLYKRFAVYGMPPSSTREILRRYKLLALGALRLWRMEQKARLKWVRKAAVTWGRLRGSLRYRTLYL